MHNTGFGFKWLVLSMVTCTVMEGILFHLCRSFSRPYYASLLLNLASVAAGIPCAMAGAIISDVLLGSADFMIVATLLTIGVECFCALKMSNLRVVNGVKRSNTHTITSTIIANLLSNVALFFLLIWMSHLYPPYWVFLRECRENERQIRQAAHHYVEEHNGETNVTITVATLLSYLPDHKMPLCPFGGTYNVQSSLTNYHQFCTHGRRDKPLRWRNNSMKSNKPSQSTATP
jgi:hypothetical protein